MATNLKELRAEIFESGAVFGDTGAFAETITFFPRVGPPRQIDVACRYQQPEEMEQTYGEDQQETLWVNVARDENCARGGIARPEIGDRLLRAADADTDRWSYQNQIRNETPHSWDLLFARNRPRRYGPAH